MTAKADFNAEEWSTVVEAPAVSALRVIAAHRGGKIRESIAVGKVYAAAREAQGESGLLDALVTAPPAVEPAHLQAADERLREALRIVADKATPEELEEYKRFVMQVADAAARAHKEGGFIGIGGKEVSAEEQAVLDQLQRILDA